MAETDNKGKVTPDGGGGDIPPEGKVDDGIRQEMNFFRRLTNALLSGEANKPPERGAIQSWARECMYWLMERPIIVAELINKNHPFRDEFWQRFDYSHDKFWVGEALNPKSSTPAPRTYPHTAQLKDGKANTKKQDKTTDDEPDGSPQVV